jgi:hypothetical protein
MFGLFSKQKKEDVVMVKKENTAEDIRNKIKGLGWQIKELPIKSGVSIKQWKLIAIKGEKSVEVRGQDIKEALDNLGRTLGAIK